ncbi:MAG TPA: ATP-binding protein [Anaerolineales bacterium]
MHTLYEQGRPVLLANAVNAFIVTAALWSQTSRAAVGGWAAAILIASLARAMLHRRYGRVRPAASEAHRWGLYFTAGSAISGTLWGLAVVLFFQPGSLLHELLIAFVIGGMATASAATLSCFLPAFYVFLCASVLPLLACLIIAGDSLHIAMAGMVAMFVVGMVLVARNVNTSVTNAHRLRFEKAALVEKLLGARSALDDLNRDLERRVQARSAELWQAQRMEAIGRLAGGVAHDFNNILTVILPCANYLAEKAPTAPLREAAVDVVDAAQRAASLTSQLLAFACKQVLDPRVIDVNGVVSSLERMMRKIIGENVRLEADLAPMPMLVMTDAAQLEQVIVNLVTNARDAMPAGGLVRIQVGCTNLTDNEKPGLAGEYVTLVVSDNGAGMDENTRQHVFEPFFTTKAAGRGTGLGLATAQGFVLQSGGQIEVESDIGKGSSFRIYLPRRADAPPAQADFSIETVLLVDDQEMVRRVAQRILEHAGYRVLVASEGEEALRVAQQHDGSIDILVSDVMMPGMSGVELSKRITSIRPRIKVLLISGYLADAELHKLGAGGAHFLAKPFTLTALCDKVRDILHP